PSTSSCRRPNRRRRRRPGRPPPGKRPRRKPPRRSRSGQPRRREAERRGSRNPSRLEKPPAQRVVKRAEAPENRDAVQDEVQERLRRGALESRVHEHELQAVRPMEKGSADQDEEEQADERVLPVSEEGRIGGRIDGPQVERGREEEQEERHREQERGDEAADGEEAPEYRLEEDLVRCRDVRMHGLAAGIPRERFPGRAHPFGDLTSLRKSSTRPRRKRRSTGGR